MAALGVAVHGVQSVVDGDVLLLRTLLLLLLLLLLSWCYRAVRSQEKEILSGIWSRSWAIVAILNGVPCI